MPGPAGFLANVYGRPKPLLAPPLTCINTASGGETGVIIDPRIGVYAEKMTSTVVKTPPGLGKDGRALWRAAVREFQFNAVELELLRQMAKTLDEAAALEAALATQGPTVKGHVGQPRLNPIYAQLTTHRKLLDQLACALALPLEGEAVGRRRSAQAKQAVDSRWRKTKSGSRINTLPKQENVNG